MKSILFALLLLVTLIAEKAAAQQKPQTFRRCATMDRLQLYEANNQAYKIVNAEKAKRIVNGPNMSAYRLQAIVTIPVVVHIVLPNPFLITDADVQTQIDRLNQDFAGLNPDSTNAKNFYLVRGHSRIQFCLARRSPAGLLTNGIDRRSSSTGSNANAVTDPIKRTAQGGLDAWSTDQYLNLWIGTDATGQGILGYASTIGPGNGLDDGMFLNYQSFGSSSCYTLPVYNRGRTATHEIGHYFGLYHIWGDDDGCSGDDFEQLPASTSCTLPNGLFNPQGQGNGTNDIGDTPNQASETSSCPSGSVTDGCSASLPGKMYQNHMDYTQDACLSMFTKKQVSRMEWVLDNCRAGLKTSPGCQPPANALTLDVAASSSVSPGGFELSGCTTIYYPDTLSCAGSITPKFLVKNNGLTNITSLTTSYSYDNGPVVTQTVTVSIAQGGFAVVSFAPIFVAEGTHSFRFTTSNPNGSTDQNTANDNYSATLTVLKPINTPLTESFDAPLNGTKWTIDNPDVDFTWQRTSPGRNASAGKLSIDNYNVEGALHRDDFRSTTLAVNPAAAYVLKFDLAHKNYPDNENSDTLAVLVSPDCGQTFTRIYRKGGTQLATAGSSDDEYVLPNENDWRTETVDIPASLLSSGKIILVFRNISRYGNWIHLDNINLENVLLQPDLEVMSLQQISNFVCTNSVAPSVSVRNVGNDTVQSFNIVYQLNGSSPVSKTVSGSNLAKGAEAIISLPALTGLTPGQFTLRVYSANVLSSRGTADSNTTNDTLDFSFAVPGTATAPLSESFVSSTFPPQGWSVLNADASYTWQQYANGNGNAGSAWMNTFNYPDLGQQDDLATPIISFGNADSIKLSFDLAAALTSSASTIFSTDTLEVLVTKDCGASFTIIYKKWGAALQTISSSQTTNFFPQQSSQWRKETVDMTAFAGGSPAAIFFRVINNNENNIFLDNVNITTRVLPTRLKQEGYLIYPSPFKNGFTVWHYQTPTTLRYIKVMNAVGQTVFTKTFNGNAEKQEAVDLTGKAAGVYIVELGYGDGRKAATQMLVKDF